MGGYLSNYGAGTEKRDRVVGTLVRWALIGVAAGGILAFTFTYVIPNRGEQAMVRDFFQYLAARDYKSAYALWGCTDAKPCRDYPTARFMEDWGPAALSVSTIDVMSGESCGSGVIVDTDLGKAGNRRLWVETSDRTIGVLPPNIAELGRCPQGNRIYDFVRDLKYRMHGRTYK
jgi:hypothetical protein